MKIATWNVNSLRVRLPQLLDWLAGATPDVVALQETKTTDEVFPVAEISAAGYNVVFSRQKTYNGVAVLARTRGYAGGSTAVPVRDLPTLADHPRTAMATTLV